MSSPSLPEVTLDPALHAAIRGVANGYDSVAEAEAPALVSDIAAPLRGHDGWEMFCNSVATAVRDRGYVVLRGLAVDDGRSLLVAATALGAPFECYAPLQIVKRFRMSPWTNELSHTLRAGSFHTDGNASVTPPFATAMQCEQEDPGGSDYAEQRVAHLPSLLDRLASAGPEGTRALRLLADVEMAIAQPRSPSVWRGRLVQDGAIRYHPESLRVARKRLGLTSDTLEEAIATIHDAAMAVSLPFHTGPGDTVLVSNRTALHYRGACSVRFTKFPTEFESRSLLVLHLREPPE